MSRIRDISRFGSDRLSETALLIVTLAVFIVLAILVTYPTSVRLAEFSVLNPYTDDLLEAWTIEWDVHSILSGLKAFRHIWDANIFYPYPLTLAFTEHLLPTALLLMPFALLGTTPLVVTNLGVLFTMVLSGWGMYLLVTWLTGNRWAGLVAGIFFAIAPFRMSHITQLHLISTHWIPFIFLVAARLVRSNRNIDLVLLVIFANLQFWSVINYAPVIAIGLAVWIASWLFVYRKRASLILFTRLAAFGLVTLALNWPVLRLYQQVSDRMGLVRTLGDATLYGASFVNYVIPIANSLLYGRLLQLPTHLDYLSPRSEPVASAFAGIVVILLAFVGITISFRSKANRRIIAAVSALSIIVVLGFLLSLGSNANAFGQDLSPVIARLLPYPYLYQVIPLFQGLRVPFRFALLPTLGLAVLAGIGFAAIGGRLAARGNSQWVWAVLASFLILVEHLSAPLPGVSIPSGNEVYSWLATRPNGVVLELPYYLHTNQSYKELARVYESPEHWHHLINGNSGFEPEWLVELGPIFDGFPDWRSFDVIRQLEVDYVVLHRNEYQSQEWETLTGLLPGYLPSIDSIYTIGEDLILELKPSNCEVNVASVTAGAADFPRLIFHNDNPSSYVTDPHQVSTIISGPQARQFLEPLFILPGQTLSVDLPVGDQAPNSEWQVDLANLGVILAAADPSNPPSTNELASIGDPQPVQIPFANQAVLQSMALSDAPTTCGVLVLKLEWIFPDYDDEVIHVELIDRFDRTAVSNNSRPVLESGPVFSTHFLPLAETIPPGLYQLQVRLISSDGAEISPIGPDGSPANIPLSQPVVIRSGMAQPETDTIPPVKSLFGNGVGWLGSEGIPASANPGDWIRFTLWWQSPEAPLADYTIFTQLIGPDGQVWGQHDNPPGGGWYSMPLWSPQEIVSDGYAVRLDPAAPPGEYHLIAGLYNSVTGERVSIDSGSGAGNEFVDVATISVSDTNNK